MYNGMPKSLGIVRILIHRLRRGSVADKPHVSLSYVYISAFKSTFNADLEGTDIDMPITEYVYHN